MYEQAPGLPFPAPPGDEDTLLAKLKRTMRYLCPMLCIRVSEKPPSRLLVSRDNSSP